MKSQRKKKLLKTIKNVAIIALITATTLKLSSFFKKESEIQKLKDKVQKLENEFLDHFHLTGEKDTTHRVHTRQERS